MKLATKTVAVYPVAWRYARPHAMFMSTGLTLGTISASYGYTAGIFTQAQFSVLVTVVVLSAVVPTAIAQRFFSPPADTQPDAQAAAVRAVAPGTRSGAN